MGHTPRPFRQLWHGMLEVCPGASGSVGGGLEVSGYHALSELGVVLQANHCLQQAQGSSMYQSGRLVCFMLHVPGQPMSVLYAAG